MRKRTYISLFHTDPKTETTKELKFNLDKIDKVDIDINLTVCSSDTVRGRNKTDHAYREQNIITISGSFSERTVEDISSTFFKFGKNKLKNIQELFLSFLNDGRLFYIYTRVKTYKNYVLKNCSFSYTDSVSSIKADFTFVEIMLRNNPDLYLDNLVSDFKPTISYSPPISDAVVTKQIEIVRDDGVRLDVIEEDVLIPTNSIVGDVSLVSSYNNVVKQVYSKGPRKNITLSNESFEALL